MSQPPGLGIDSTDAQQCMALLTGLPLTKTGRVHEMLTQLLEALAQRPPPPLSYLQVLEIARAPLAMVQEDTAQRYAQRSLVPGSAEEEALARVVRLWQLAARAYAHVAQIGGALPEVQNRLATICQRCIHYAAKPIFEYYRARRELPRGLWIDVYGYYSSAEEWDLASMPVAEPLNDYSKAQSPAQAFAAALLVDLGNPYGRPPREFEWLLRWAQRFSIVTEISPAEEGCDVRQYAVDLMQDRGPRPLETLVRSENVRRLTTSRLSEEFREVARQLKLQVPPAQLGLGETAAEPAVSKLLVSLYRPWCLASSPRRFQRRAAQGKAQIARGMEAIHYFVTGAEFIQPEHVRIYSRTEFETIVTFRHQVDPTERLHVLSAQVEHRTERWDLLDQSVGGFRLLSGKPGDRIEHAQLLAMRPPDGDTFLLSEVRWLMYQADGGLVLGISVLPGVPRGVAVRPTGPTVSRSERYSRAFLLPELPALKEPETLVLPKGWFQPDRVLEIHLEASIEVRLVDLLTPGHDFERVSFVSLPMQPQGE